jgi:hypothetical protein
MCPDAGGNFPPFEIPAKPQWLIEEENAAAEKEAAIKLASADFEPPAYSHIPSDRLGRFSGANATETERAAGAAKEAKDKGPLKRGGAGHAVLDVFVEGEPMTSYDASFKASGDYHMRRRECTRLVERGHLRKEGTLPNKAQGGSEKVDAYILTPKGVSEQQRLGPYSDWLIRGA